MAEHKVDPKKIGFAIITSYPKWYRGRLKSIKHTEKVRGDLALEFVQKAVEAGYPIVVSDGRSTKTFRRELEAIPGVIILKRKTKTSGEGKRTAIDKVSKIPGVEAIVLSEPEKVSLLTNCLEQIVKPILQDKADIVIPKRNDELFKATYPRYMYDSEVEGNSIYNEALRANDLLSEELFTMDTFFWTTCFSKYPRTCADF